MNSETAAKYFSGVFTGSEREFLFAHPEFKATLAQSSEELADLKKLNTLGVKLLLIGEYRSPVASATPPGVGAPGPLWS